MFGFHLELLLCNGFEQFLPLFTILTVVIVVRLQHRLDLTLSALDDLLDQLALHEQELNAEPDIRDVILPGHHQVEAVVLVGFNPLLLRF